MNMSSLRDAKPGGDMWLYVDELTHRAFNDYSVMLSMLRCASRGMTDAAGLRVLDAVAEPLQASAGAYAVLRPPRGPCFHNLDDELERLCALLTASFLADRSIGLTLACERVCVSARRGWQISLIVFELVMNAARHAFTSVTSGEILVEVRLTNDSIRCAIADNGTADPGAASGRGASIVDTLAADLEGTIVRQFSQSGSTVLLTVPLT